MEAASSIAGVIEAEGGRVTFARFMEIALTHPTLGYYDRTERLLGLGGDFSTAPSLSPFFCRTVARLVTELVESALAAEVDQGLCPPDSPPFGPSVVELGGGEGHLADAILSHWEKERREWRGAVAYRIVEVGAGLRRRQEQTLARWTAAGWDLAWGPDLETACAGTAPVVIFGNEFMDALPVHVVELRGEVLREAYVQAAPAGLAETRGELSPGAAREIELLFGATGIRRLKPLTQDGILELRPATGGLVEQAARLMPAGSLVTIDYGEWFRGVLPARAEDRLGERPGCGIGLENPDRTRRAGPTGCADRTIESARARRRSVRSYFKHQLVPDPLARPGGQDLTADLDFAALDLHGRRAGFETVVFTTLSAFLRAGGAEDELERLRSAMELLGTGASGNASNAAGRRPANGSTADPLEADRQATVLEHLLDERDLGGAFKVMVQVRE